MREHDDTMYSHEPAGNVRRVVVLFLLSTAALIALMVFGLVEDYRHSVDEAERVTQDAALTLQQHLLRTLEATDLTLQRAADRIDGMAWDEVEQSHDIWAFMAGLVNHLPQVRSIWLADPQGRMRLYSAKYPTPELDISTRDYFIGARETLDGFFVGDPIPGRFTGMRFFSLSRRINGPNGEFVGVVAAAMEPEYFSSFHRTLPLGPNGQITFFKTSGVILARMPRSDALVGQATVQERTLQMIRENIDQGTYYDEHARDGGGRYLSFQKLDQLPLVVSAAYSSADVWHKVLDNVFMEMVTAGISLVVIVVFFVVTLRRVRHDDRFHAATAERENLFRSIFTNAGTGIVVVDYDGTIRLVNDRLQIMLGYHAAEMLGKPVARFIHPDDYLRAAQRLKLIGEGELDAYTSELRCIKKDGGVLFTSISTSVKPGPVAQAVAVLTDIGPRVRAEEQLRQSEFKFRTIADFTYDWEFWLKPDYTFEYNSPSCVELTGYSDEEFEADPSLLTSIIVEEDRDSVMADLQRGFTQRRHGHAEFRLIHRHAGLRWMALVHQPIIDAEGHLAGLRASVRDVTERKEMETLREEVERITRHDLKGPLMASITVPRIMKKADNLTPHQMDMLEELEQSGLRMLNMINESLSLYRIETGHYQLDPAPMDLLQVSRQVLRDLESALTSRDLTTELLVNGTEPGPDQAFALSGEELLIYSMLTNLVKNAVEASPDGTAVTLRLDRDEEVHIAVHNKGAVPSDVRARFFDKYTSSGKRYGTGLGTYSARLIAETHKGRIVLDTSVEDETTVTVHLPG